MPNQDQIAHAAEQTRVVLEPRKVLETFGETVIYYYVLSDLLDDVGQVRIRQGKILAHRPRVLTPGFVINETVENFGEEAREYAERLFQTVEGIRILQYGLRFRKEEYGEEVVSGEMDEIADQVVKRAEQNETDVCGVIVGVDDLWEVSLLKFARDVVQNSLPKNVQDLGSRGLLESAGGNVPRAVRIEVEADFRAAAGNRGRIEQLAVKLRRYGLFQDYEDRFYALLRSV